MALSSVGRGPTIRGGTCRSRARRWRRDGTGASARPRGNCRGRPVELYATERVFDIEGAGWRQNRATGGGTALGRIRKLLARAERAGTPEEAQAYTDKAVELMARHGIDMALLAAAEPGCDEIGATRVEVADPYSAGKARLLGWTASALRCRAVLHQAGGGPGRRGDGVRVRVGPRAGRGPVHLAAPAGRGTARARRPAPRVSPSRRTGGRGCTGSRCRCTGGSPTPNAARAAGGRDGRRRRR